MTGVSTFLKKIYVGCIISIWAIPSIAQETGRPFINNFYPQDYLGHAQTWSVEQDSLGLIYIGTSKGIQQFDGETWRKVSIPGNGIVREMTTGPDGRIYLGTVDNIGYLAPDSTGQVAYHSLNPLLVDSLRSMNQVWTVQSNSEYVFFQTYYCIYVWDGESFSYQIPERAFHRSFVVNDTLYATHQFSGILKYHNGEMVQISDGDEYGMEPIFLFEETEDGFITSSYYGPLKRYRNGRFEVVDSEINTLINDSGINDSGTLPNGDLVIVTLNEGVIVTDPNGHFKYQIDKDIGLISDNPRQVFVDREDGIWVTNNNGLSRIEIRHGITAFDASLGIDSHIERFIRFKGDLYASTLYGVNKLTEQKGLDRFEPATDITFNVLDVETSPDRQELVLATNNGISVWDGDGPTERVSAYYTYELEPSRYHSGRYYAAGDQAIFQLDYRNGEWIEREPYPGAEIGTRNIAEESKTRIWAGTESRGVVRVDFNEAGDSVIHVQHYTSIDSAHQGGAYPFVLNGTIYAHTEVGIYEYYAAEDSFQPSNIFGKEFRGGISEPVWHVNATNVDTVYFSTGVLPSARVERFIKETDGTYRKDSELFTRIPELPIWRIYQEKNGNVWVGTTESVYKVEPRRRFMRDVKVHPLIRNLSLNNGDSVIYVHAEASQSYSLSYPINRITISYAFPSYDKYQAKKYRTRLAGFDDRWSDWSHEVQRSYTNLPDGKYLFEVEARDGIGVKSGYSVLEIIILPPWYKTTGALLLFGLVGFGGLVASVRYVSRRKLLRRVKELEWNEKIQHERQRISKDLHDNVGVQMTNLISGLEISRQYVKKENVTEAQKLLKTLDTDARKVMSELRETIWVLHQEEVSMQDFCRHLRSYFNRQQKYHTSLRLKINCEEESDVSLDSSISLNLLRIIQETLNNTVKYAEATTYTVAMSSQHEALHIKISDDGNGFNPDEKVRKGFGITNIYDRVNSLGGSTEISTQNGVQYSIKIPLYPKQGIAEQRPKQ